MKRVLYSSAILLVLFTASCSSENKQEQMYDTSVNADTTGIVDTSGTGSLDQNTPASTGSSGRESVPTQR